MGSCAPLLAVQLKVLQGAAHRGTWLSPAPGTSPLLPWQFPAPLCQLQDGVENPGTRNFLTNM